MSYLMIMNINQQLGKEEIEQAYYKLKEIGNYKDSYSIIERIHFLPTMVLTTAKYEGDYKIEYDKNYQILLISETRNEDSLYFDFVYDSEGRIINYKEKGMWARKEYQYEWTVNYNDDNTIQKSRVNPDYSVSYDQYGNLISNSIEKKSIRKDSRGFYTELISYSNEQKIEHKLSWDYNDEGMLVSVITKGKNITKGNGSETKYTISYQWYYLPDLELKIDNDILVRNMRLLGVLPSWQ